MLLQILILKMNSVFFQSHSEFNLQDSKGSIELSNDLNQFLIQSGVGELESKTAENYVLNPHSGEWIEGMQIVAAEAGLKE